ncbi:MAG: VOC family protein [Flavobacteriales bacterium]|nr:VOC family protein [Flavobacteriales bacterium]
METLKACRVNVMVSDIGASIEFYQGILGLEMVNRYGDHYAEIQGPGLMLGLHPSSDKLKIGNNLSIGFGVGDFDLAVKELEAKGIELKVENEGWVRLAYFADPDENQLYLAENKS